MPPRGRGRGKGRDEEPKGAPVRVRVNTSNMFIDGATLPHEPRSPKGPLDQAPAPKPRKSAKPPPRSAQG